MLSRGADFCMIVWKEDDFAALPHGEFEVNDLSPNLKEDISDFCYNKDQSTDIWNNPYRIIHEDRGGVSWVGLYSSGEDGVSLSKGNDEDDINSWSESGYQFYSNRISSNKRVRIISWIIYTGVAVGLIFVFAYEIYKASRKGKLKDSF